MPLSSPRIVTGIINGDEDAWSRACALLGDYYETQAGLRGCIDTTVSGDPYADDTVFSGTDVMALHALGVHLTHSRARALIGDARLAALAEQIPALVDLVDADDDLLKPGSAAERLWQHLTSPAPYGLSWKDAAAVMARLRPRLFPVMTGAERKAWGLTKDMPANWIALREILRKDDARLAYQLYYLIQTAPVWSELSQLQVLQALIYADYCERTRGKDAKPASKSAKKARRKREKRLAELQAVVASSRNVGRASTAISKEIRQLRQELGQEISTSAFRLKS